MFWPRRILCRFGLKFFPWSKAAKVEPHLSDIIISSHAWSGRGVTCGYAGFGGGLTGDGSAEDARLVFPCSPQPMKTLEGNTFPSARPGDTLTPGKAWVNTKDKATGWGRGALGRGGCQCVEGSVGRCSEPWQPCASVNVEAALIAIQLSLH